MPPKPYSRCKGPHPKTDKAPLLGSLPSVKGSGLVWSRLRVSGGQFLRTLRMGMAAHAEADLQQVNLRDLLAIKDFRLRNYPVWFLVRNRGMGYGDYYWGLYRDYYRDPFPNPY